MSLAARGSRQFGDMPEKIDDPEELAQVRRQARWVHVKSLIAGIVLTAIAVALPLRF